jgi:hypothetical protein
MLPPNRCDALLRFTQQSNASGPEIRAAAIQRKKFGNIPSLRRS